MLNTSKVALTLSLLVGGAHVVWSVLVALGFAQSLMDFVFWAHMVGSPFQVTGFDITAAGLLVVVTAGIGYIIGWVFATIWNNVQKL